MENNELPKLYPCHCHSWFSFADSCISPKNLVKRMKELDIDKTAITDHGNVLNVIRFNTALKNENMTLYPGSEFYFTTDVKLKDDEHRAAYHLTVVAYNQEGLQTLYKLSSLSYIEGFYYKPKIDFDMLKQYNKGIRVSSACIKGLIADNIINDRYEEAKNIAAWFKDLLGDNFYLEIMPHNLDEQRKANLGILQLSKELDIPLLATYDAHMCWQNEVKYRRMLIQMSKAGWASEDPELGMTDTIYMMSAKEYIDFFRRYHPGFPEEEVIKAIANTEIFLGNEHIEMETDQCIFPKIDIPAQYKDELEYIRHLLWDSMKNKGLDKKPEYIERVKQELKIMNDDGFVPYFLVLYDVFNWCRENEVMTGPGRGCFTQDAMVVTNHGLKYINDITTEDKVITSDGKFEKVLKTHKYDISEETIEFNYLYNGNVKNRCTKDHKILVKRNDKIDYIQAQDLVVGDLLCSPKIHIEQPTQDVIDLNNYNIFGYKYDNNYIYETSVCNQNNCSPYAIRTIAKKANLSISCVRNAFNGKVKTKQTTIDKILSLVPFATIEEWRNHVQSSKVIVKKIKRYINNDKEFNTLLGLLYGDGFTGKNNLCVGLAINPTTLKDTYNRKIFENFANQLSDNILYESLSKTKKLSQLYINSKIFTNYIITEHFVSKKGRNKQLNCNILLQNKTNVSGFIKGLLQSDGHISIKDNRNCFDNTSQSLIGGFKIANSIIGEKPLRIQIRPEFTTKTGYKCKESYKLVKSCSDKNTLLQDENYWFLPVTNIIKHDKEKISVYDLTIENNPSYMLNNIIVHNSGAGCLMNYLLGITRIDPLKFELRFDRFYNAGRKGPDGCPDVDSDFADARREEVIKYTEQKYGSDKISQICNIGTMGLKTCIKDVARVMKIPFAEANTITNKVEWEMFESLDEAKEDKTAKTIIDKYKELFEYVEYFFGFPRQLGKHAAGIIISNKPIGDVCPMTLSEVEGKKFLISQFDKDDVHKTGLIKFDYLGLSTLTFLTHILKDIKSMYNKDIDLDNIDLTDKAVYSNVLATADTDNVFQMESGGMRGYLKRLQPDRFGDLSALNSLYRPAGIKSGAIDNYINNKFNEPQKYGIPELDELLAKTNYVVCYDEIKMDIVDKFGDFDPKDVNKFRKSSGKKDPKSLQYCQDMKPMFVENAQKHGLTQEKASELYDSLIGYAFCKAHADCYSILTYWTAWLKYYYPVNFLHASFTFSTLDIDKDKYSVKTAIKMAKRMGYGIAGIDINKSGWNFKFDDDKKIVYWSLRNIKQVSEELSKQIEEHQPYVDFNDFIERGKEFGVTKRAIEPLVTLGAFDSLNCEEQIKEWYIKSNKLLKAKRIELGITNEERDKDLTKKEIKEIETKLEREYLLQEYQKAVDQPSATKENNYLGVILSMDFSQFTVNKKCITSAEYKKLKEREACVMCGVLTKKELKKSGSGKTYGVYTVMTQDYNFYSIQLQEKSYQIFEEHNLAPEFRSEPGDFVMWYGTKSDETRMFLNNNLIVNLVTYQNRINKGEIKHRMVFI